MSLFKAFVVAVIVTLSGVAQAGLIRAEAPSEISSFESEWCAPLALSSSVVQSVCFGSTAFGDDSNVRAFVFTKVDGTRELYVESEFRGVDLLRREIEIIGPLKGRLLTAADFGTALLTFDARGEVSALRISTRRLGTVVATRPQR